MQEFVAKREGDWRLVGDLTLTGMVVGTVAVPSGVTLIMTGTVTGDLIAEQGAHVVINGTVGGAVENRGATVEVNGVVGSVRDSGATRTFVDGQAIVRNSN